MYKSLISALVILAAYLGFTGFSDKTGTEIGNYAPDILLESMSDSTQNVNLAQFSGEYVLLNFWNTSDANSRLADKNYQLALQNNDDSENQIKIVSVNVDANTRLAEEIVKFDRLDPENQYVAVKGNSRVIKDFKLQKSMKTFLLNPLGEIVAVNPTIDDLKNFNLI